MSEPLHITDVFLQPGDCCFGDRRTRLRTLLGSCVAITLWHPRRHIGGMCHYMLPERAAGRGTPLDGKYADEALTLLAREIARRGTALREYEIKLFGGGDMFPSAGRCAQGRIGARNARFGKALLERQGLRAKASDLGGYGHRKLIFDLWSGHVWVARPDKLIPGVCDDCEIRDLCFDPDRAEQARSLAND